MRLGEIVADRRHQVYAGEEARRVGEIRRRAAEGLLYFAEGSLDAVERHRADHEQVSHCSCPPVWRTHGG